MKERQPFSYQSYSKPQQWPGRVLCTVQVRGSEDVRPLVVYALGSRDGAVITRWPADLRDKQ